MSRETMEKLTEIRNVLADLDEDRSLELVRSALEEGIAASDVLKACQEGMTEVGARFESEDYFVSDLIMSGEIFKQVSAILEPFLQGGAAASVGKVVFGTVKGDIHDIGKDIVVNMLRSASFEVVDLGVDVAPERFVEAVRTSGATVVGMSGLLTLAFDSMRATVAAIAGAGLRDQVRIMVGGGPVDANVCKAVGADDWGSDAQVAVRLAKQWIQSPAA
jgi:methanogenic corrinoid protein MtbC1